MKRLTSVQVTLLVVMVTARIDVVEKLIDGQDPITNDDLEGARDERFRLYQLWDQLEINPDEFTPEQRQELVTMVKERIDVLERNPERRDMPQRKEAKTQLYDIWNILDPASIPVDELLYREAPAMDSYRDAGVLAEDEQDDL